MWNRRHLNCGVAAFTAALLLQGESRAEPAPPLNLETAIELAEQNNRLLDAARARIQEAEGDLVTAGLLLLDNPELTFGIGPRIPAEPFLERTTDWEIGIGQRFPIAGQRGHRKGGAGGRLEASRSNAEDVQRVIALAVATAFYDTLGAGERVGLREEAERLASDLHQFARRRLELGEATPLELNTTQIRLAEARRQTLMARTMLRTSSILVTELLGLEFEEPLTLRGELPIGTAAPSEISLVAHALRRRPDLSSVGHEVSVARSDVELAEAEAWPDVSAGFRYERDEGDDKYMAEVAIPLPIFNRNQGEVIRARGTLARLRAEEEALRLAVESDVRRAVVTYEQARQGTALYGAEVLDAQEESLDLLMRAFQAGEISYSEVVVVQRALIEGREGYLDIRLDFARARAQLIAATHLRQTETLEVLR